MGSEDTPRIPRRNQKRLATMSALGSEHQLQVKTEKKESLKAFPAPPTLDLPSREKEQVWIQKQVKARKEKLNQNVNCVW